LEFGFLFWMFGGVGVWLALSIVYLGPVKMKEITE